MSKLYTIVGGQFGSEGKGQIAAFLTKNQNITYGIRIGGPNAGHTAYTKGRPNATKIVARSLPTPVYFGVAGIIGAEGLFSLPLLKKELKTAYQVTGKRPSLIIDTNAAVITEEDEIMEADLKGSIGSTGEGVGACTARRIMRRGKVVVGQMSKQVVDFLQGCNADVGITRRTSVFMNDFLETTDGTLLLEGTQGWGLGLYTGGYFPFCTSRESTPQSLWAGTGINPDLSKERETIMVLRTFPIRVGGNSGDLPYEVSWEEMKEITGGYIKLPEITSVTQKPRRIARFDDYNAMLAMQQCGPDYLALTFLDYVYPELAAETDPTRIRNVAGPWIDRVEGIRGIPIKYVSTGPGYTTQLLED